MSDNNQSEDQVNRNTTDGQEEDFAKLFEEQAENYSAGESKNILMGRVISKQDEFFLIDVGQKLEGRLHQDEIAPGLKIEPGAVVPVVRAGPAREGSGPLLSIRQAVRRLQRDWLRTRWSEGRPLWAQIFRRKADGFFVGLSIEVEIALPKAASLPRNFWRFFSYPAEMPSAEFDAGNPATANRWLGKRMEVKILDYRGDGTAIVSRKKVLDEKKEAVKLQVWEQTKEGDLVMGKIKAIEPQSLRLDISGIEAFLPHGEASWYPRPDLSKRFRVGDVLEVCVMKKDGQNHRLTVSRRAAEPHPADELQKKFAAGSVVEGVVSNVLANGGCFVRLTNSRREAFIPATETLKDAPPKEGEKITATVLRVDRDNVRVVLSPRKYERSQMPNMMSRYTKENQPMSLGQILNPTSEEESGSED
ncbi:MAG: 30S ribosomal protein S1 [Elusimicrobia bacterium]|nr:30S ribosomal protein S1 [Elusimicrobiota bacterium]